MPIQKDITSDYGIAYVPRILRNMNEICAETGVSIDTVQRWVDEGAPIAIEGEGRKKRYSTEVGRLQIWREQRKRQKR